MRLAEEYLTVDEVAQVLQVSHDEAMRLVRSGDIVGVVYRPDTRTFLIPRQAFDVYRRSH